MSMNIKFNTMIVVACNFNDCRRPDYKISTSLVIKMSPLFEYNDCRHLPHPSFQIDRFDTFSNTNSIKTNAQACLAYYMEIVGNI